MSTSLLDILGILIAFITVILILSVIVTALVQAIQALLRLRAHNLKVGLTRILESLRTEQSSNPGLNALRLMNAESVGLLSNWRKPEGLFSRLIGPQTSWMTVEQLRTAAQESVNPRPIFGASQQRPGVNLTEKQIDLLCERFEQIQRPLQKRFLRTMRLVTLACALLVAFVFQVSAPRLLEQLSANPALASSVDTESLNELYERVADRSEERVVRAALESLAEQYPELKTQIVAVMNTTMDGATAELKVSLNGQKKADDALEQFATLLGELYQKQVEETADVLNAAIQQAAIFEVRPWPEGAEFYTAKDKWFQNIVGVLLTAILLSFGAPFWFEMLGNIARLRDTLAPPPPRNNKTDDDRTGGAGTNREGGKSTASGGGAATGNPPQSGPPATGATGKESITTEPAQQSGEAK